MYARAMLTIRQVAERLNVHRHTVRHLWKRGELPAPIRVGTRFRWEPEELEAWIRARREVPKTEEGKPQEAR